MRKRTRALTLVELLVVCGLMVLLMGVIFVLILVAKNLWLSSVERSSNLAQLRYLMNRIEDEWDGCQSGQAVGWISANNGAGGVCFPCYRDAATNRVVTGANGTLVVQRWLLYYRYAADSTVRRLEYASQPATSDLQAATQAGQGQAVGTHVNDFSCDLFGGQLRLRIGFDSYSADGREDQQYAYRYTLGDH